MYVQNSFSVHSCYFMKFPFSISIDLYKGMLQALIEMCGNIPANKALVWEIATRKNWTGSVAVQHFLYDFNYGVK